MDFYPVFLKLAHKKIIISGATEIAAAKIRLLKKTPGKIVVYGENPIKQMLSWHENKTIELVRRKFEQTDLSDNVALIFAANGVTKEDLRIKKIGNRAAIAVNIVDDLKNSDFLTPAIIDRDPVTIAICTSGTAPVLARKLKGQFEETIPSSTGILANLAKGFRKIVAKLPNDRMRREFWVRFFERAGPIAYSKGGESAVLLRLNSLYEEISTSHPQTNFISLIGAGTGDPELLTLKARKRINAADIVIYDPLVSGAIIDLARREAQFIEIGDIYSNLATGLDNTLKNNGEIGIGGKIACIAPGAAKASSFANDIFKRLTSNNLQWEIVPGIALDNDIKFAKNLPLAVPAILSPKPPAGAARAANNNRANNSLDNNATISITDNADGALKTNK